MSEVEKISVNVLIGLRMFSILEVQVCLLSQKIKEKLIPYNTSQNLVLNAQITP